jgi:hypothetical protein
MGKPVHIWDGLEGLVVDDPDSDVKSDVLCIIKLLSELVIHVVGSRNHELIVRSERVGEHEEKLVATIG